MSDAAKSSFVYVTYIRTTPELLLAGVDRAGIHTAILVRGTTQDCTWQVVYPGGL